VQRLTLSLSGFGCLESTPQEIPPFTPNGEDLNILAALGSEKTRRRFDDIGIKRACQALVAGDDDQQDILLRAFNQ